MIEELYQNQVDTVHRMENMLRLSSVSKVDEEGRSLVKLDLGDGLESDWVPLLQVSTPQCTVWVAPKVGEQVVLLSPSGEAGQGLALRGIFWKGRPEPKKASPDNAVVEFSDGTEIVYDVSDSSFQIKAQGKVSIECENAEVKAGGEVHIDSPKIKLGKTATGKVVTTDCICSFTGAVHMDGSEVVSAQKI